MSESQFQFKLNILHRKRYLISPFFRFIDSLPPRCFGSLYNLRFNLLVVVVNFLTRGKSRFCQRIRNRELVSRKLKKTKRIKDHRPIFLIVSTKI